MTELLHEWVTAQAKRDPEAVALVMGQESMTYGELDRRSNVAREPLDADDVPGRDTVLLPTGTDDGVGHDRKGATLLPREAIVCT